MTHHFSCSGHEKIKKGPKRAKRAKKGHFGSKFWKKKKIKKKNISIWMILSQKKAKKTMKKFSPY